MNKFITRSKMPDEKLPLLVSSADTNTENESFKCFSTKYVSLFLFIVFLLFLLLLLFCLSNNLL